ncbi:TldD/PmbA family protein [Eubacterium oxidoreducens]|uniref:PmbA protein n=1 Tax=Eubacterium oxidoreducens TaxID=1732 RepID=A0A1G6CDR3_EUBOX|nr:TldD/PmbA family protein [Eubacterium oxidoreducens]SDB31019.1 PmbA protein [Eubacterium oxidoreducens]
MQYQEFKDAVIAKAKAAGLTEYELYYAQDKSIEVETLLKEVDKYMTSESAGVCFRCIYKGNMGYASTELFDEEQAAHLVKAAMENASLIEEESENFIYAGGAEYPQIAPKSREKADTSELMGAAVKLQEYLFDKDERISQGTQSMSATGGGKVAIYNSNGIDLENEYEYDMVVTVPIIAEGQEMYNAVEYDMGELGEMNLEKVAQKAYEKCVRTIGAKPVASGNYPVVFERRTMQALLANYSTVFCADKVQKGLSLLKGKLGKTVAFEGVTILDDPMYEGGLIRRSFDDEGVPAQKKAVVDAGKLKTFLYDLKTAAKDHVTSTGNAAKASYDSAVMVRPSQMYMKPGESSFDELLKKAGDGIVVTQISGMHAGADTTSGDFSLNVQGYRVRDGKAAEPVNQITVAGNFYQMLKDIIAVGDDLEMGIPKGSSIFGAPSVLVASMAIAGE